MSHVYSMDASALIQGWSAYPISVFEGLWSKLATLCEVRRVLISEEVLHELKPRNEDLTDWIREHMSGGVFRTDEPVQRLVAELVNRHKNWVNTETRKNYGDPFVVAVAKLHAGIVVTAENPSNNPNGPRLPDICRSIEIKCGRFILIPQLENWKF